jgi:hypothetical protein
VRRHMLVAAVAALVVGAVVGLQAGRAGPSGRVETDVSALPGPQTNATIAVDPRDGRVLLAGSNSFLEGVERVYGSTDAGQTWHTTPLTPPERDVRAACASDPAVAIDRAGRQFFSFDRSTPCTSDAPSRVYVATRSGPAATWSRPVLVAPLGSARIDDKPAIAVDDSPVSPHAGRIYVAWARVSRLVVYSIVLSHSDDHGRTWSTPLRVNRGGDDLNYATIGVARDGAVYVGWTDASRYAIQVVRSVDGGEHFGPEHGAAGFSLIPIPHCGIGLVLRADPRSCIQADPTVLVDASGGPYSGRVYVSYTATAYTGVGGPALTTFDAQLRPLSGFPLRGEHRIVGRDPGDRHAAQFWVQAAVDQGDGTLWLCFYDTAGDASQTKAWYSCSVSADGGRSFAGPLRVAGAPSDESLPGARQFGYYQGVAVANGVAHPVWTDTRRLATLQEEIYAARVTRADFSRAAQASS